MSNAIFSDIDEISFKLSVALTLLNIVEEKYLRPLPQELTTAVGVNEICKISPDAGRLVEEFTDYTTLIYLTQNILFDAKKEADMAVTSLLERRNKDE